jgi:hypothetical protein
VIAFGTGHRSHLLEVSDGSTDIAYRLTAAPEKIFE